MSPSLWSSNLPNDSADQLLQLMQPEVVVRPALFLEECRLCHTYLNQQVVSMGILILINVTTPSHLNVLLVLSMAHSRCPLNLTNHILNKVDLCIMQTHLVAAATQGPDHISKAHMAKPHNNNSNNNHHNSHNQGLMVSQLSLWVVRFQDSHSHSKFSFRMTWSVRSLAREAPRSTKFDI
jgi:hypothetical protein